MITQEIHIETHTKEDKSRISRESLQFLLISHLFPTIQEHNCMIIILKYKQLIEKIKLIADLF